MRSRGTGDRIHLDLAELQRPPSSHRPFGGTVVRQIPSPIISGFGIWPFSQQQQRQIEHCIDVVGRHHQGLGQTFDSGFSERP